MNSPSELPRRIRGDRQTGVWDSQDLQNHRWNVGSGHRTAEHNKGDISELFSGLMGDEVSKRREFIQDSIESGDLVANLDI